MKSTERDESDRGLINKQERIKEDKETGDAANNRRA
jgi:hypothetical protein